MRRLISRLTERLRTFCGPPARQRSQPLAIHRPPSVSKHVQPSTPAPATRWWNEPIDGTSTPLVRPYLTAYERDEKARIQRLRRDILWCATYGVDLDTRDIHARPEVAA